MNEILAATTTRITRRGFLAELTAASAAVGATFFGATLLTPGGALGAPVPIAEAAADSRGCRRAVVGFHMDQPYLDVTGTATPYHPPDGMRSAEPVAHLSEEAFRRAHAYVYA